MPRLLALLCMLLLAGCSQKLTERNVREFVDDADRAFLAGHASDICDMRDDNFQLTSATFKLAAGHIVRNLEEAEAIESQRHQSGERATGEVVTMNARDFCRMAMENRESYRRMNLVRTALVIRIPADGNSATVRAHYVLKSPEYVYGESRLGQQDHVEQQIATVQTETDEDSVVTRNANGDLVFTSTRATSKQFRVPKERDKRL